MPENCLNLYWNFVIYTLASTDLCYVYGLIWWNILLWGQQTKEEAFEGFGNLPDVLDVHVDDEAKFDSLHENLLLDVGQGEAKTQAVDLEEQ